MRILLDQGTPVPLRRFLTAHEVITAFERGWATLQNGELLSVAEADGIDLLITTDSNLRYQQDLSTRRIGIVVLKTTSWPRIKSAMLDVVAVIEGATRSTYIEVVIP